MAFRIPECAVRCVFTSKFRVVTMKFGIFGVFTSKFGGFLVNLGVLGGFNINDFFILLTLFN
jgi:hypothetical protein